MAAAATLSTVAAARSGCDWQPPTGGRSDWSRRPARLAALRAWPPPPPPLPHPPTALPAPSAPSSTKTCTPYITVRHHSPWRTRRFFHKLVAPPGMSRVHSGVRGGSRQLTCVALEVLQEI